MSPPHIGVVELLRLGVDLVHGGDDLLQHQGRGDLEDGVPHVLGVGTVLVGVEPLDEGEHQLLHHRVHLPGGEVVEPGPLELFPGHGAVPHLDLPGKNALVGQAQHGALLGSQVVRLIQVVDEHEVGHLLHHVQGVGDAAGPEGLPEAVNFVSQFACQHFLLSPDFMDKRYGVRRHSVTGVPLKGRRRAPLFPPPKGYISKA